MNGPVALLTPKPLRLHRQPWPLFGSTATIDVHRDTIVFTIIIIFKDFQTVNLRLTVNGKLYPGFYESGLTLRPDKRRHWSILEDLKEAVGYAQLALLAHREIPFKPPSLDLLNVFVVVMCKSRFFYACGASLRTETVFCFNARCPWCYRGGCESEGDPPC